MSKKEDFKKNNPLESLITTSPIEPSKSKPKKKAGRPKTIDVERKNINIAVPVELLNKFDEVKTALGGNMTAYVVNLIKKDMDAKYKDYKDISSIQKDLGL